MGGLLLVWLCVELRVWLRVWLRACRSCVGEALLLAVKMVRETNAWHGVHMEAQEEVHNLGNLPRLRAWLQLQLLICW